MLNLCQRKVEVWFPAPWYVNNNSIIFIEKETLCEIYLTLSAGGIPTCIEISNMSS
jgi:hypothetical protein